MCYLVQVTALCWDRCCNELKPILLLYSCRVSGSLRIPRVFPKCECVWLSFPDINVAEMVLVVLVCVRGWAVCMRLQQIPGASAAAAWWRCGCMCWIWQCPGSCRPLCPSGAEGFSPGGCWEGEENVSETRTVSGRKVISWSKQSCQPSLKIQKIHYLPLNVVRNKVAQLWCNPCPPQKQPSAIQL